MRSFVAKIFTILFFFLLPACNSSVQEKGNGNIIARERVVEAFNEIAVNGNFKLLLKKSAAPRITITTDENLHRYITLEQHGDVLRLSTKKLLMSKSPIEVLVEYNNLVAISSSGSSNIQSGEIIEGNYFRIGLSGSGTIELMVNIKALKVSVSGAGTVKLKGNVTEQNVQLTGAGGLEAYDLISQKSKINISGVGGASIHVEKRLEASVTGVGGISYRGDPEEVISDISGLGTIHKAGEK